MLGLVRCKFKTTVLLYIFNRKKAKHDTQLNPETVKNGNNTTNNDDALGLCIREDVYTRN